MQSSNKNIIIECPHCKLYVQIFLKDFNCKIFRHGIYKHNFSQIDPHFPKKMCDLLVEKNLIYGCGKPYELILRDGKWNAVKCEYK